MLNGSLQPGSHTHVKRGLDLYQTPACATEAILRAETLPRRIWEPAAGHSAIADVLRGAGHTVVASDIADYGRLDFVADFHSLKKAPERVGAILDESALQENPQVHRTCH